MTCFCLFYLLFCKIYYEILVITDGLKVFIMNMFNAGIKRHLLTLQLCTIYLYLNLKLSEAFLQEERTELFDTEHERAVSKFYRGLLSKSQILCYNELKGAASTVKVYCE